MNKALPSLVSFQSRFGEVSVVWLDAESGPVVKRIFLSNMNASASIYALEAFPGIESASNRYLRRFADEISFMFSGNIPDFDPYIMDFSVCSSFQRNVLLEEKKIPRGEVLSYAELAMKLGMPHGARAVGRALSSNPFPLVIPCHRTVRSDGGIGGFQGGTSMKRSLLEMEGFTFSQADKLKKKSE